VEKNNKILLIPETMQGISTSAESKEERSKKNKKTTTIELHVFVEAEVLVSVDDELDEVVKEDSSTEIEKEIKLKGQR
jgi:hypothetical protein